MSCPPGRKKKSAKQTFDGPLCFMKATELVISPSCSMLWREATPHSQPLGTVRGWTWPVEWSNHTHLLVLLLFTVLVCTSFLWLLCLTWSFHFFACPGTLRGDCVYKSVAALEVRQQGSVQTPWGGCLLVHWALGPSCPSPPPPSVDGRKRLWCQVLLLTSPVSHMEPEAI